MNYRRAFCIAAFILLTRIFAFATDANSRISQAENVRFPKNGALKISAVETIGKDLVLRFSNPKTGKIVRSFQMTSDDADRYKPFDFSSLTNAFLRFRVLKIKGLPSPLVHAVAVGPGGSDHGFLSVIIGEIKGKLKILSPPIETSIQGGVHLGSLGANRGSGIAVWNFIWGNDEIHHDEHRYNVTFYRFDAKSQTFIKGETINSKRKHENYRGALNELKLSFFKNDQNAIPKVRKYREEL